MPEDEFPPVENALREPDGLLAAGGDLATARLLAAYRRGIFPWYEEGQPLLWWSPDPRCVLQAGQFHVSRSLRRYLRQSPLEVTFNTSFGDVIRACAGPRRSQQGTWITPDIVRAFETLHGDGWAHSIEVRQDNRLAGGLYGLAIGRVFFAESMFSRVANASKIAMLVLAKLLDEKALGLVDCQVNSAHLQSLGATLIARQDFVASLDALCEPASRFENWPSAPMSCAELSQK
ncbi:MAG: leucyl/phenylalanyl-tRNA--protein transferase [Woeseiaceae bacterium]|nr:leucyl/phenylalanyl-tRNA--protein transferase [Woeseiaceae bacterium]